MLVSGTGQCERILYPDDIGLKLATGIRKSMVQGVQFAAAHANIDRPICVVQDICQGCCQEPLEFTAQVVILDKPWVFAFLVFGVPKTFIVCHVVWWVCKYHVGQFAIHQPVIVFSNSRIAAQQHMFAKLPQVALFADNLGFFCELWHHIFDFCHLLFCCELLFELFQFLVCVSQNLQLKVAVVQFFHRTAQ